MGKMVVTVTDNDVDYDDMMLLTTLVLMVMMSNWAKTRGGFVVQTHCNVLGWSYMAVQLRGLIHDCDINTVILFFILKTYWNK